MLKADPDWIGAAQDLVSALEAQPHAEGRVEVLEAVRDALGDQIYPAYIKLLAAVARFGDASARKLVADAFADALATSKAPSVFVPAYGGSTGLQALSGGLLTHRRAVGPIEFLCLWVFRDIAGEPLEPETFETAMAWLVRLFEASPRAAVLYQAKLSNDAESPLEGLHDRDSRAMVRALLESWESGASPEAVAAAARRELRRDPFASLPMR